MYSPTNHLYPRWAALCLHFNPAAPPALPDTLWHTHCALYAWPHRAYHTLDHIAAMLTVFAEFVDESERPREVEFALFLHDAVYISGRADNEPRSADVAAMFLHELHCDRTIVGRMRDLVMATTHQSAEPAGDAALIADIDLAILGSPRAEHERYAEAIASEYAFAGRERYRMGRSAFLTGLLARPRIFRRPSLQTRFETQARANIARELAGL